MLVPASRLIGTTILSMQASGPIGYVHSPIIDPDNLKIVAFYLSGHRISRTANILDAKSIREYSKYGMVIDSSDELVSPTDVIHIDKVIQLNFSLTNLKVETKKGTKLGHVTDFTVTSDNFTIEQLIVKRPLIKSFLDSELTIPRSEIVEVTNRKIVVKNEEKTIRARAEKEDFVPNFVNPFRTAKPAEAKELKSPE